MPILGFLEVRVFCSTNDVISVWYGSLDFYGSDILKTIFDALHDRLHAISEKMAQVAKKVVQSGQPPSKMVKNQVFTD